MRKYGPFNDSVFYEVENRRLQRALGPQTGFVKTGQGAVSVGTGAQLVIAAYPDGALIDGEYVENPEAETVSLTTNTASTNPRIDRLVLRLDMTVPTIAPFQIVGTPAASPVAPGLTQTANVFDLPLYRFTMPGSAAAQAPSNLVDERVYIETGWLNCSLIAPWTGPCVARRVGQLIEVRCDIADGSSANGAYTVYGNLPPGIPAPIGPLIARGSGMTANLPVHAYITAAGALGFINSTGATRTAFTATVLYLAA